MDNTIFERFWSKVDRSGGPDDCWNWTAALTNHGYGIFAISHNKHIHAHRFALIASGIEITDDQYACHTCDNRKCCNPNHLYPGTPTDNVQDMMQRGRQGYATRRGASSNFAKLTQWQVNQIRSSTLDENDLARMYGVHVTTIRRILNGKLWPNSI